MNRKNILAIAVSAFFGIAATAGTVQAQGHGGMDMSHTQADTAATKTQTFTTKGEVREINLTEHKISIYHEAVPAINWPVMTMRFTAEKPELLNDIAVGDTVKFDFYNQGDASIITYIETK